MNNLIISQPIENSNDHQNQTNHSISGSANIMGVKISIEAKGYAANDSAPSLNISEIMQPMTKDERQNAYGHHLTFLKGDQRACKNLTTGANYPGMYKVSSLEIRCSK